MKKLTLLLLFLFAFQSQAQEKVKEGEIDFEIKNDTVNVKKTKDYLMDELLFGNRKEVLNFSLVNENGVLFLHFQAIETNSVFIPTKCFDKKSKIFIQLQNGKIVTLISTSDTCSQLYIDPDTNFNTQLLSNYFLFSKANFEDLKQSPISMIRVNFGAEYRDYVPKKTLVSELNNLEYSPENYFINNIKSAF